MRRLRVHAVVCEPQQQEAAGQCISSLCLSCVAHAQGFEDEVLNVLIKRYPPNLLADLQVCRRW